MIDPEINNRMIEWCKLISVLYHSGKKEILKGSDHGTLALLVKVIDELIGDIRDVRN